jgi:hypothetical protein
VSECVEEWLLDSTIELRLTVESAREQRRGSKSVSQSQVTGHWHMSNGSVSE